MISNSGASSIENIQDQMFLANCPLPIYNGVATLVEIDGFALNYTVTYHPDIQTDFNGTYFECSIDLLSNPHFNANTSIRQYGATTFWGTIPYGWLGYLADSLTILWQRTVALFTMVSFFVSPTNFNILGYTINDLTGIALMLVIVIYGLCYLAVGAMMYKIISPFAGLG